MIYIVYFIYVIHNNYFIYIISIQAWGAPSIIQYFHIQYSNFHKFNILTQKLSTNKQIFLKTWTLMFFVLEQLEAVILDPKKKGRSNFLDQITERVKLPRIWSFRSSKCSLSKWVFWGRANVLKLQRGNSISCYGRPHQASTSRSSMIISLLILS